jgi:excisionase family DNA binding protein
MTVDEAAKLLNRPRRTLADQVRRGVIPSEKLPGKTGAYLLERADVERLREQSCVG